MILAQALLPLGQRQSANEELWKAIDSVEDWDVNLVGSMVVMLRSVNADDDLVLLKKHLRENVEKKKADVLIETIEASIDLYKNEKIFREVLDYDLGQIAGLARRKGVKLVLRTYPEGEMEKAHLNNIIRAACQKYHICFIENGIIFKGKSRSEFFVADGHCNGRGYGLMAGNIYETLVKNGILSVGSVRTRGDGK